MSPVSVVGAGPAGLMAAWRLARAGHECTVFEAGSAVGGMARSITVAGQRVDLGSHRLHPATPPPLLAELKLLLGADLQTRPRNGRIRLHDRWVAFPLQIADLARNLPIRFSASVAIDTGLRALRRGDSSTFMEEVSQRMGPTVARDFYGPYAEKLYGVPAETLDAEQAERRIAAASPLDVAGRLVGRGKRGAATFLYPRRGYGTIVERLADATQDAGAEILLDTPVAAIDPACPTVFTAAPSVLASLLGDQAPSEVVAALQSQKTRAMVLVYLVLDVDRYTPFDAHYLPGPDTPISRLSEPKNYRDGPDPVGQTVLCAEIPCWQGDPTWTAAADELGALVATGLVALGLPAPPVRDVEVHRLPSVYPVYEHDTAAERARIRRWSSSLDNVLVLGRQGLAVPDNLHHVLAMGADAADCIRADGSINSQAWRAALESFVTHVVED